MRHTISQIAQPVVMRVAARGIVGGHGDDQEDSKEHIERAADMSETLALDKKDKGSQSALALRLRGALAISFAFDGRGLLFSSHDEV